MTEDEKYEIATLATAEREARQRLQQIGMTNQPSDPVKADELHIAYRIAQTEWFEALTALHRAMVRISQKP